MKSKLENTTSTINSSIRFTNVKICDIKKFRKILIFSGEVDITLIIIITTAHAVDSSVKQLFDTIRIEINYIFI